jgi:release factor glutamine methyltransferase
MEVIQRLVVQAADRLRLGGWLILEISPMIEQRVHDHLTEVDRYDQVETIKDLAGRPRVVKARRREDEK